MTTKDFVPTFRADIAAGVGLVLLLVVAFLAVDNVDKTASKARCLIDKHYTEYSADGKLICLQGQWKGDN